MVLMYTVYLYSIYEHKEVPQKHIYMCTLSVWLTCCKHIEWGMSCHYPEPVWVTTECMDTRTAKLYTCTYINICTRKKSRCTSRVSLRGRGSEGKHYSLLEKLPTPPVAPLESSSICYMYFCAPPTLIHFNYTLPWNPDIHSACRYTCTHM